MPGTRVASRVGHSSALEGLALAMGEARAISVLTAPPLLRSRAESGNEVPRMKDSCLNSGFTASDETLSKSPISL